MFQFNTGSQLKAWRLGINKDQKEIASVLGVSSSTLCRIEKDDRILPEKYLTILSKLANGLDPESPIARSIPQPAFVDLDQEPDRVIKHALAPVSNLALVGRIYPYQDYSVVPSQYYARWSEQETKHVNQVVDRLSKRQALEEGEDFFRLSVEQAKDFIKVTNCDLEISEVLHGLVLLTRRAVNSLTHHFKDSNSVEKSKHINSSYTSFEEVSDSGLPAREKMAIMLEMCKDWLEADKERARLGFQIEAVAKKAALTSDNLEVTKARLEAHQETSRLSRCQIDELEDVFKKKNTEYGHPSVQGLVQRHLKWVFLGERAHGNTFKDIAQKDYSEMLRRAVAWEPTPAERETIKKRRIKSRMEPPEGVELLWQ